jgi:hypothetical protein
MGRYAMLTENEKKVLRNRGKSLYKVRFKARRKTKEALEDLKFLSEVYPEAVSSNLQILNQLVSLVLRGAAVTREDMVVYKEGKRKGKSRAYKCCLQVATSKLLKNQPEKPDGKRRGWLKKQGQVEKLQFCYRLLDSIHEEFWPFKPISPMEVFRMKLVDKGVSCWFTRLDKWQKSNVEDSVVLIRGRTGGTAEEGRKAVSVKGQRK